MLISFLILHDTDVKISSSSSNGTQPSIGGDLPFGAPSLSRHQLPPSSEKSLNHPKNPEAVFQPGAPCLPGVAGGVGPGSQTVFPFPPFPPGPPGPGGANPFTLLAAVGNKLPVTSGGIVGGETGATFQALLNVMKQQQHHYQLKRRREGTKLVDFIMFKFK